MLEIKNLSICFEDTVPATQVLSNFSLKLQPGERVGIVGESGSGKTMMALALMGLLKPAADIECGEIWWEGKELLTEDTRFLRGIRGREISMIFQEPMTSLNPVLPVGVQVEESLRIHTQLKKAQRKQAALEIMKAVELPDPEKLYRKYPHQLSGGMRQRIMIASALILNPKLMIADEPTTALDVTIQAQILELLRKISGKQNMALLFISHDLKVIKRLCSRVLVMENGAVVEEGTVDEIFYHPRTAYTRRLLDSIPTRETRLRKGQ